jgi:hypothetical protein
MSDRLKQFRRIATRYDKTRSLLPWLPGTRCRKAMDPSSCQQGVVICGLQGGVTVQRLQRVEPANARSDDGGGVDTPDEGRGVVAVHGNEEMGANRKLDSGSAHAVFQVPAGHLETRINLTGSPTFWFTCCIALMERPDGKAWVSRPSGASGEAERARRPARGAQCHGAFRAFP